MPGLRGYRYGFDVAAGEGESPYFCVFEADFDDPAAMGRRAWVHRRAGGQRGRPELRLRRRRRARLRAARRLRRRSRRRLRKVRPPPTGVATTSNASTPAASRDRPVRVEMFSCCSYRLEAAAAPRRRWCHEVRNRRKATIATPAAPPRCLIATARVEQLRPRAALLLRLCGCKARVGAPSPSVIRKGNPPGASQT
jgi:hypothetical protein